ncbi:MAG: endonuclease domain-containing protein [Bacteroidota bacterium]|nr:endonuclease domain-containing protein [Bacteroidota bacterium]
MNYSELLKIVRDLRKSQTKEEAILWNELRNRKLNGKKFLRQHPIIYDRYNNDYNFFVVDFYCAEKKLVIELDGKIHDFQKKKDDWRESILKERGLKVVRIRNEELPNLENVKQKIMKHL